MKAVNGFGRKLDAALTAAAISRVGLARELEVDKSLVGRWLSGAVHPTEHNLIRIVELIGNRCPQLQPADWHGSLDPFLDKLGMAPREPRAGGPTGLPSLDALLAEARVSTERQGGAYEGFWRTSRRSVLMPDTMFHDYGLIRRNSYGMFDVVMGGAGLAFEGFGLPAQGNLFVFLHDRTGMTPISVVFRGVALPRAMVLDGILLLAALDASRTPASVPIVMERVGDLSGDPAADLARVAGMDAEAPEPLDPVPIDRLREHLWRNIAGTSPAILTVPVAQTLSRGAAGSGLRG